MMQTVTRVVGPYSGPKNHLPQPRVTLFPRCGHITRRNYTPGRIWVKIHCGMCTYLYKEREEKNEKRARKMKRREARKRKQQLKVERLNMAKKKMASKKVAKKKNLKKGKSKGGVKPGRKLTLVAKHVWAPKGSLLSKVLKAMQTAEKSTMGENELVVVMEKSGVKAEGKKTVKKLVKATLRNMLRAGVIVKSREIKNNDELSEFISSFKKKDEDADEDEDEDGDDEDGESEDADEDGDGDEEDEEEEKPKKKKKVIKKKKSKK